MNPDPANPRYQIHYFWAWVSLVLYFEPFVIWLSHLMPGMKPHPWSFGLSASAVYLYLIYTVHKALLTDKKARIRARNRRAFSSSRPSAGFSWTNRARLGAVTYAVVMGISLLVQRFLGHPTPAQLLFDSLFLPLCWVMIPWAESRANTQAARSFVEDTQLTDMETVPAVLSEERELTTATTQEIPTLTQNSQ